MALRFIEGAENLFSAGNIALAWDSANGANLTNTLSRSGSYSFNMSSDVFSAFWMQHNLALGSGSTVITGFGYQAGSSSLAARRMLRFEGNASTSLEFRLTTGGEIQVTNAGGGTVYGTTTGAGLSSSLFTYIEIKVLIHASAGTIEIRSEGLTVLTLTGIDTLRGTNATYASVSFMNNESSTATNNLFDDIYVCDGTGSDHNNFLGPVRVATLAPTSDLAVSMARTGSGLAGNYDAVDDTSPDGDTDYVSSPDLGTYDLYGYADLPANAVRVIGAQQRIIAKKDDTPTRNVKGKTRVSGVDYNGSAISVSTSYANKRPTWALNPATNANWSVDELNAAAFGQAVA